MDNLLGPDSYRDASIFKAEMEHLFPACWVFAGLRDDLSRDGDWIATRIGHTEVTVQNHQGELYALHNVCSHRFAIMRTQACGTGSLVCPYHGWIYDCEGHVSAIPARPKFSDLNEKKIAELKLLQFSVACCGRLVFVRLENQGPELRDYCGGAWNSLEQFSEALGAELHSATLRVAANWKLVVENSLESYHSGCVHPETFGYDRSSQFKIEIGDTYARYEESASPPVAAKWNRIKKAFASRSVHIEEYVFYSLFPTFSIDTLRGATYILNVIRPVSLTETEIQFRMFGSRLSPRELENSALVRAFYEYWASMAPLVVQQDKAICESVQLGVQQARFPATLSEEEKRILAFQKSYKRYIR